MARRYRRDRVPLGHADADATLQGGLALGAVHEVFAEAGRQSAAATGFVAGLAGRVAARRPVVWVRQDFTEIESGGVVDERALPNSASIRAFSSACAPPSG